MSSSNIRTLPWVFVIPLTFDRVQIAFQLNFYLFTVIATAAIGVFIDIPLDIEVPAKAKLDISLYQFGYASKRFLVKWIFFSRFRILIKIVSISHAILALFHHFCYIK